MAGKTQETRGKEHSVPSPGSMTGQDLKAAHEYAFDNRPALENDRVCGCFHCLKIFSPREIDDWILEEQTAACPYCGVDSILGESSGYPITEEFLKEMHAFWFRPYRGE